MPGIKRLRKIQIGKETVAGTAVPATAVWRGIGTIEDTTVIKSSEEDIGYIPETDLSYIQNTGVRLEIDETESTFEQLPYIMSMGVKDVVTSTSDGNGTGKIWSYPFATTEQAKIKSFTVEGGDNQQAEEFAYGFVEEFTISGVAKEAVKISAIIIGRQASTTTFTSILSTPVEEILFGNGSLSIDDTTGTIGTTTKANTLLGFKLKAKTGLVPVWTSDNLLYFDFVKQIMPELELEVTFEHDTTSVAEKAAFRAKTSRLLQLNFTGSALQTPDSETTKRLTIQLAGIWTKFEKIDEQDGNDIVTGIFRVAYNTTSSQYATITIVNEVDSI